MSTARSPLYTVLSLLAVCAVAFLLGSGHLSLIEKDEPRYAGTAREMVRSGDWLVPRFNGQERLVKPPLAYWAMASAAVVTGGADERSARLPSAVAATLLVLLAAAGAGRAFGTRWGGMTGAAVATCLLFTVEARLATTDMLFTLFFTAAAACWIPVLEGGGRTGRWILLSGLMAGLAGLVKTPVAILLPPAAAALAALLLRRAGGPEALPAPFRAGNRGRTALLLLGAVGVFAAVFLLWAIPVDLLTEGRLTAAFREQLAERVDTVRDVHVEPFWYYLVYLVPAVLPWSLLLPAGGVALVEEARRPGRGAILLVYAASLAAVVVVFFSALPSKLVSYILPVTPPLAVIAAAGLQAAAEDPAGRAARLARWIGGAGALLLAAAIAAAPLVPALREKAGEEALREAAPALSAFAGFLGLGGILLLAGRWLPAFASLALMTLSGVFTLPPLYHHFEVVRSAKGISRALLDAGLSPGDRLFDLTNQVTGIPYYADHPTEVAPGSGNGKPSINDFLAAVAAGDRAFAVVEHEPEKEHADGKRTQWERLLDRWQAGAPPPRILFRGMKRVAVTAVPGPR